MLNILTYSAMSNERLQSWEGVVIRLSKNEQNFSFVSGNQGKKVEDQ